MKTDCKKCALEKEILRRKIKELLERLKKYEDIEEVDKNQCQLL